MPLKRFKFLQKLFGELKLTYRPSTIISEFPGRKKQTGRYKILGADASSIAIINDLKLPSGSIISSITHIHFEKDYYWICLGGMREFFKQINRKKSPKKKRFKARNRVRK
jgi:hypothetical protein